MRTFILALFACLAASCGGDPGDKIIGTLSPTGGTAVVTLKIDPASIEMDVLQEEDFVASAAGALIPAEDLEWEVWEPLWLSTTKANVATIKCLRPTTSASVTVKAKGHSATGTSRVTCRENTTTTTIPPNAVTPEQIVGTFQKKGSLDPSSTKCNPSALDPTWTVDLVVSKSSDGNLGIKMTEPHAGFKDGLLWFSPLAYSQFRMVTSPDGATTFTSGKVQRNIAGINFDTELEITFKPDGTFSGREKLTNSAGCVEIYNVSGRWK